MHVTSFILDFLIRPVVTSWLVSHLLRNHYYSYCLGVVEKCFVKHAIDWLAKKKASKSRFFEDFWFWPTGIAFVIYEKPMSFCCVEVQVFWLCHRILGCLRVHQGRIQIFRSACRHLFGHWTSIKLSDSSPSLILYYY